MTAVIQPFAFLIENNMCGTEGIHSDCDVPGCDTVVM
jgi:hypothetical protein